MGAGRKGVKTIDQIIRAGESSVYIRLALTGFGHFIACVWGLGHRLAFINRREKVGSHNNSLIRRNNMEKSGCYSEKGFRTNYSRGGG